MSFTKENFFISQHTMNKIVQHSKRNKSTREISVRFGASWNKQKYFLNVIGELEKKIIKTDSPPKKYFEGHS